MEWFIIKQPTLTKFKKIQKNQPNIYTHTQPTYGSSCNDRGSYCDDKEIILQTPYYIHKLLKLSALYSKDVFIKSQSVV